MSSVLTIAGSTITRGMGHTKVLPTRLTISLDRPDEFEFVEIAGDMPGQFQPEQAVTLTVDGTLSFSGAIYSVHVDGFGTGSGRIGYRCLGLSYAAALVAITAADGTGTQKFNLPTTDPEYSATEAGLSVGTILSQVIAQHSSQLTAIGVSTDGTTTSQLAALTVVPPEAVYISGNSLWVQLQQLVQAWYGSRHALYITAAGKVRCYDTTALTVETITLDSDPAILDGMNVDTSECYTQVILRGRDWVEGAYFDLLDGTLIGEALSGGGWTPTQQAAWNVFDWKYPQGGFDQGTITALSSGSCTIQSDDAALAWAINYWGGIQGQITCINPAATGITMQESRHITANGAMTAGGTCSITFDSPLNNSGYTRYKINGIPSGLSLVWRKYRLSNSYIAQHLVQQFNYAYPFQTSQNSVAQTNFPAGVLCYNAGGGGAGINVQIPFNFEVVPYDGTNDGYIIAFDPVVVTTNQNSAATLAAGGSGVVGPTNIIVLLPYSRGALTVTSPFGGGHSGTAYSLFGVQRTLYRDYPTWISANDSTNIQTLADQILSTVSNAVFDGNVTYLDKYTNALPSGSWPIAINVAKATGTTGYESIAAPCRTVTLEWPQEGASLWITHLSFSTKRQQYSGDRLYVHPAFASGSPWAMTSGVIGAGFSVNGVEVSQSINSGAPEGTLQQKAAVRAAGPQQASSYDAALQRQQQQAQQQDAQQRQAKGIPTDEEAREKAKVEQQRAAGQQAGQQREMQRRAAMDPWQAANQGFKDLGMDPID